MLQFPKIQTDASFTLLLLSNHYFLNWITLLWMGRGGSNDCHCLCLKAIIAMALHSVCVWWTHHRQQESESSLLSGLSWEIIRLGPYRSPRPGLEVWVCLSTTLVQKYLNYWMHFHGICGTFMVNSVRIVSLEHLRQSLDPNTFIFFG